MYVVVQHRIKDPAAAFTRGEKLIKNEGAPAGVQGLQFYPSTDRSAATCLWDARPLTAPADLPERVRPGRSPRRRSDRQTSRSLP